MNFEMMQASIQQEKAEKYALLMPQLKEVVKNQDWEGVETLLTLSPDIMAEGLEYAYPYLPDEYKFRIPTDCYTQNGDHMPIVRKYVRQARKYAPIEKRIPAEMIPMKEITIYRAGIEPWTRQSTASPGQLPSKRHSGFMTGHCASGARYAICIVASFDRSRSSGIPMIGTKKK